MPAIGAAATTYRSLDGGIGDGDSVPSSPSAAPSAAADAELRVNDFTEHVKALPAARRPRRLEQLQQLHQRWVSAAGGAASEFTASLRHLVTTKLLRAYADGRLEWQLGGGGGGGPADLPPPTAAPSRVAKTLDVAPLAPAAVAAAAAAIAAIPVAPAASRLGAAPPGLAAAAASLGATGATPTSSPPGAPPAADVLGGSTTCGTLRSRATSATCCSPRRRRRRWRRPPPSR